MSLEAKVHAAIERLAPEYIEFLRALIQVPSITGDEGRCQALVKRRMQALGVFTAEVYAANDAPFLRTRRTYTDRPCIIGHLGQDAGPRFVLNAHIDTAPVEDPNTWTHPPFSAHMDDKFVYGRGAVDDKSGVAIMLMIADALHQSDVNVPGSIFLESVIEDEDSGNGTLACQRAGYHCEAAIIIDGTWPGRVIDGHLGQVWLECEICGIPAAASSRNRGANPVDAAMRVIQAMRGAVDARCQEIPAWLDVEAPFFVNVGSINAGVWAGAVPETCRFAVQVGFPPPYTPAEMVGALRRIAKEAVQETAGVELAVEVGTLMVPPFTHRGNPLVALLMQQVQRLGISQDSVRNQTVRGHCDLRHLRQSDGTLADALLYGPGGGKNPHARNEHYHLEHFVPVAQVIASTALVWFGVLPTKA